MGLATSLVHIGHAQVTQRVGLLPNGQPTITLGYFPSVSADGRFVAFSDRGYGGPSQEEHVFVRDRRDGVTECVSVASNGMLGNAFSTGPSLSADGRYVVFQSRASNLVPGDTNGNVDVFVHDRLTGTNERVNVDSNEIQANGDGRLASISADGRFVAFISGAYDLVPGQGFGERVFVRDLVQGTTEVISVDSQGGDANGRPYRLAISADGRFVAFSSEASDLVPGDTNESVDVFVRDRWNDTTEVVSVSSTGSFVSGWSAIGPNSISADGRYVVFSSAATDLVPGDTNGSCDVFLRDRQAGTTERISVDSGGPFPSISEDGRFVAFQDAGGLSVLDRDLGTTEIASVSSSGALGGSTEFASISADGRAVAFYGWIPAYAGASYFLRDRFGGPSFTSLCEPGVGGVIPCPCSNPPAGPGRGCDNSAATGGAILSAFGGTYLSSDSLFFGVDGMNPTALGILFQSKKLVQPGAVYGQGVRCMGVPLRRLYMKSAVAGGFIAPDLAVGDPPVTVRSAATGDTIQSGQSRWYFVHYRDPIVLNGCPPSRTFNATQAGIATWTP